MNSSSVTFTPLRISTNTATGNIGGPLKLDVLFEQLPLVLIPFGYPEEGILKMEHKDKRVGASQKDMLTKKKVAKKTFFNQSTLVVRKRREDDPNVFKEVNIKLFANGGIQMTGITGLSFGETVLKWLLPILSSLPKAVSDNKLEIKTLKLQLINSDYHVNGNINRDALHNILSDDYHLFSSFEKLIHQGVNVKYYYNKAKAADTPQGICMCPNPCTGTGEGESIGDCKKITVLAFQTGDIIVTGARRKEQLEEAYGYMNTILKRHSNQILRPFPTTNA